ncbi:MAG TPA: hypothetical protein VLA09_11470 [Longimicrobiales bacterium]|nr:hypothetical protein [Longimicrobiales bacterium]
MKVRTYVVGLALGLLLCGALVVPGSLDAQAPPGSGYAENRWPLQPRSGIGRIVAPFLEGWYRNPDGTISYSFGYLNMNDSIIEVPIGEQNVIEPAQFNGMQPTIFLPGRHRGMFAVTVPASMEDDDVWWTITNPNGEVAKVPGRTLWSAYMLDWIPRPHGTVPPVVAFEGGQRSLGAAGLGPIGVMAERTVTTTAGAPTTLSVDVRETSERDTSDPRFREPTSLRVVWTEYQAPAGGRVEFTRHESTPIPEEPAGGRGGGGGGGGFGGRAGPEAVMVPSGTGTALVVATFSEPGEYMILAQVDNWRSPDSSSGDQCCWTNGYVRVTVR